MLIFLQFSIGTRDVVTSSRHRPFCFHNFVFLLNCLFILHRPIENRSALGGNTLLLFSGICTGCLSDAVSSSSWRRSCSRRWTAWHRRIWRMIVILSVIPVASWDHPTTLHAPSQELERCWGTPTGHLLWPVHGSGSPCLRRFVLSLFIRNMQLATRISVCVIAVSKSRRFFVENSSTFFIFSTTTPTPSRRRVIIFSTTTQGIRLRRRVDVFSTTSDINWSRWA